MKRPKRDSPAHPATPSSPGTAPFHAPFARLAERLGAAVPRATPATAPPADARQATGPEASPAPARAVVRLERKGRGGKEATVVEKLDLPAAERDAWLKQLKQALGCGGAVEGDALVLQGDLRQRVKALLEARGVRKVTLG